ncbi:MAG: DUF502 domain-containing protein [Planctomycetaceae bacterium]|jgi:uncharacterized membrane protein|nr:DUF502 domain-containing protein [Planctomycetaceae bacterium]
MNSDISGNDSDRGTLADEISAKIAGSVAAVGGNKRPHPIRSAVFRGLGVILPPLLTIVFFLWVWVTIRNYVIEPVLKGSRETIITFSADIIQQKALSSRNILQGRPGEERVTLKNKKTYIRVNDGTYVPEAIYDAVSQEMGLEAMPPTGLEIYNRYVEETYLKPYIFVPVLFILFFFLVYLIGKFIAAGIGKLFWKAIEQGLEKVPLVNTVYGAIKKVIDFLFGERDVQFSRVVAIEWPRKGIWALALVTGKGLFDIETHTGEEHYSVLVPTSPMPMTGFTLTVKKSETLELTITVDQAIQFIVSCGVVVPTKTIDENKKKPLDSPIPDSAV